LIIITVAILTTQNLGAGKTMQIKITTTSPDNLSLETLALGFFADERPPKGDCGLVDWRLNGFISNEMARGHISGALMEKVLISSRSRIPVSKIFLFGLGHSAELTRDKLLHAGYQLAETMDYLVCKDFAFNLPAAGRCHLSVPDITEAMMTGCFNYTSKDIEKWAEFSATIIIREAYLKDVIRGLENFQRNTRDVSVIEIQDHATGRS
jgi:hypothetical protein